MFRILCDECDHVYRNYLRLQFYFDTICAVALFLGILLLMRACYEYNLWKVVTCVIATYALWVVKYATIEEHEKWRQTHASLCSLRNACKTGMDTDYDPNSFDTSIGRLLLARTTLMSRLRRNRYGDSINALLGNDTTQMHAPADLLRLIMQINIADGICVEYSTDDILSL